MTSMGWMGCLQMLEGVRTRSSFDYPTGIIALAEFRSEYSSTTGYAGMRASVHTAESDQIYISLLRMKRTLPLANRTFRELIVERQSEDNS